MSNEHVMRSRLCLFYASMIASYLFHDDELRWEQARVATFIGTFCVMSKSARGTLRTQGSSMK